MIERLLIALAVTVVVVAAYEVLHESHKRRACGLTPRRDRPTLIYFRSTSCAPCIAQGRFVQQLKEQFEDRLVVEKIDADEDQEKAAQYGVFTLPTTLVVDENGVVRHANYGLTNARRLAQQLQSLDWFSNN
jgi:thiol-disulfide isomerase/thioredoxin